MLSLVFSRRIVLVDHVMALKTFNIKRKRLFYKLLKRCYYFFSCLIFICMQDAIVLFYITKLGLTDMRLLKDLCRGLNIYVLGPGSLIDSIKHSK